MTAKCKLTVQLDAELKQRFESACDRRHRSMNAQIIDLVEQWTQAQETPLTVPLSPQILMWFQDHCRRQNISPEMWVALQIQQARVSRS